MHYLLFIVIFFLQEIPLKPKEQFEIKLDYQFKGRPHGDGNTVRLSEPRNYPDGAAAGVLPYLILNVRLLQLPEGKMRMRISTNRAERPYYKKITTHNPIALDLGFTVDMIDRVTAHQYILTFINAEKEPVDRILISVEEDGSFFVNGEKRGRF
jgi:hypothetical protein